MNTEQRLDNIEAEIEKIKLRNMGVEADKAWETSVLRRILIAAFTYISISLFMWAVAVDRPWLNAIVPTIGFTLSTLALPYFKQLWLKSKKKG